MMTNPKFAVTSDTGRYYTIPGREDVTFRSVTTALNAISKPALVPWAAKMVAERAYAMMKDGSFAGMKRDPLLKHLKAAPTEYTKAAQQKGTAVHKACENYVAGNTVDGMVTGDEEVYRHLQQFQLFLENEGFTIVEQELTVFNVLDEKNGYAGTLDAIVEKDGKYYVMDIKTGRVYPSASLQMAAYAHAPFKIDSSGVSSNQEYDVTGAFVLELKPDKYAIHYMDVSPAQYELFLKVLDVAIWNTETSRGVIGERFA